jgi:hypothetical protein
MSGALGQTGLYLETNKKWVGEGRTWQEHLLLEASKIFVPILVLIPSGRAKNRTFAL